MKEKLGRRLAKRKGRGTIRCVNWETGEIKAYPENQEIGDTWIQITSFFSPFETPNGKPIVVDRTIDGAVEMAEALGIRVNRKDKTSASFRTTNEDFIDALRKMRQFDVNSVDDGVSITY